VVSGTVFLSIFRVMVTFKLIKFKVLMFVIFLWFVLAPSGGIGGIGGMGSFI
jgi:hypothetical protein